MIQQQLCDRRDRPQSAEQPKNRNTGGVVTAGGS